MGRLDGRVALVTGAGRGQGRSHSVRLAQEGADVIAIDICHDIPGIPPLATPDDLAETVRQVEALDRRVVALQADVRDLSQLTEAGDRGVEELGRLDIVSANAGLFTGGWAWEIDDEAWRSVVDVNLTGVWHTTRAATPHIIAGGRGGAIVLTSSTFGVHAVPFMAPYNVAKHGVSALAKGLAVELAPHMIRVNAVLPTTCNTPMIRTQDWDDAAIESFAVLNAMPIAWIEPEDVSNAIVFLASDEARYITGVELPVDGGFLANRNSLEQTEMIWALMGATFGEQPESNALAADGGAAVAGGAS